MTRLTSGLVLMAVALAGRADEGGPGRLPVGGPARTPAEVKRCRAAQEKGGTWGAKAAAPKVPVRLRSAPADLPENGCEVIARKWNFYLHSNPGGCFLNAMEWEEGRPTVIDRATGLEWLRPEEGTVTLAGAKAAVADLNAQRAQGHADWRLPTAEELLSLLQVFGISPSHLQPILFAEGPEWWTADRWPQEKAAWKLDAVSPGCSPGLPDQPGEEAGLLPVRTMGAAP